MHFKEFLRAGNGRVLLSAFLYFDVSFMVWVLLGALASFIAEDLGLSASEKGLVAATPILAGSAFRLVLGPLGDHLGSRRTGLLGLWLTLVPLLIGWLAGASLLLVLGVGVLLGVAGASFAVALPLASRWYPRQHQGLALGIVGVGTSGTVLASLLAPRLAEQVGWQAVLGFALLPVLATIAVFHCLAEDNPNQPLAPRLSSYLRGLHRPETVWFCFFYSVTFGGFVGLSSYLGVFFRDEYGVSRVHAGDLTAACALSGSLLRPVGGALADRLGSFRVLTLLFVAAAAPLLGVAALPPLGLVVPLLAVAIAMLGMGNGAVFQAIPQVFRREFGVITGLVGAAGGVGGFFLPAALGLLKGGTGSFAPGFLAFAGLSAATLLLLLLARAQLETAVVRPGVAAGAEATG